MARPTLADTDVLILCGGLGTRLQAVVTDRPKGLAPIHGRPFLDILVSELTGQGFRRFIMCVGHLQEQIVTHYAARTDAEFIFSREDEPLGTGGAVQKALELTRSETVVVTNGDSYCSVNFAALFDFHAQKQAEASLVLTQTLERVDGGSVRVDDGARVVAFAEKSRVLGEAFINAGIYVAATNVLAAPHLRPPFSLERDVFPSLVDRGRCFGFVVESELFDIGTPERYRTAEEYQGWRV